MSRRLILARHGNTFGPQERPVWVGANSDLPLTDKGFLQAQAVAEALRKNKLVPDSILCGPLQRTRRTAEIIAEALRLPPGRLRIDPALTEIDYGRWEGKTSEEIAQAGFADALDAWNRRGLFPADAGWQPSAQQIAVDTARLLENARPGTSLFVTSNGILRFFAAHAVNAADFPDRKVATGQLCDMEYTSFWRIRSWNQSPDLLSA